MFSFFPKNKEQKKLYFQLKNTLMVGGSDPDRDNMGILEGVYCVYKNNVCLYVGQTKNIASRLATHLNGRYENCDKIYFMENLEGYDLDFLEKEYMKIKKPTENLLINFTENLGEEFNKVAKSIKEDISTPTFVLVNDNKNITILGEDFYPDMVASPNALSYMIKKSKEVKEHTNEH